MKNKVLQSILVITAAALASPGCTTPEGAGAVGSASLRIDVGNQHSITRVAVSTLTGHETDLVRDDVSGTYIGALLLPAGSHDLIGQAFVEDELVGESVPVAVEVQAGLVVGADIRILDLTGAGTVGHRPIIVALTHPLSAVVGQPASLAATIVDPDGDPVTVAWSSECPEAVFSAPESTETDLTLTDQGTCDVSLTVSDGELTTVDSFKVVVFGEGANTGAVDISGTFVAAPTISLTLAYPAGTCDVFTGAQDGTCAGDIASPDTATIVAFADWGYGEPGTIEITDDCGGVTDLHLEDPFFVDGVWTPPTAESVCLITARANGPEGPSSEVSAAILVRDGEPQASEPLISATFSHDDGDCDVSAGTLDTECPAMGGNELGILEATIDWLDLPPGTVDIFDTCAGEFIVLDTSDPFFAFAEWIAPSTDPECELHIRAEPANGSNAAETVLRFPILPFL